MPTAIVATTICTLPAQGDFRFSIMVREVRMNDLLKGLKQGKCMICSRTVLEMP
jgi:hypothetical protein